MPIIASIMNPMLKIRWSVHPIFCNIPPQEHGIYSAKLVIIIIYPVNSDISVSDPYRLSIRIAGNIIVIASIISIEGMDHAIGVANAVSIGDCPS